jgi:hypothetical protein
MPREVTIADYESHELTNEALRELCLDNLDLSFEELGENLEKLHKLKKSLDLVGVDRFDSFIRLTNKKDVLDCPYVRKCLILLLRDLGKWDEMLVLIKGLEL